VGARVSGSCSDLARPKDLDKLLATMRAAFDKQEILKARAVEDRLMDEAWASPRELDEFLRGSGKAERR
jgi:hypothetical protein